MDFIKLIMTSENALDLGKFLILVGVVIYFSPRIMKRHFEHCDRMRQALKDEAQRLGQSERYNRLTAEEKGIARIPKYGKAMMVVGLGITVVVLVCGVLK